MRRIISGLCVWSGGLMACGPGGPVGTYVPSSAELEPPAPNGNGGMGGASADAPKRAAQEVMAYAERPEPERWCWFLDGEGDETVLYEIDLDSGDWGRKRLLAAKPVSASGNSFAVHQGQLVWVHDEGIAAVDLTTGEFHQRHTVPFYDGITANETEIVTSCADTGYMCAYPTVAALLDFAPSREIPDGDRHASLYAYTEDWLYATWHVGETVTVHDPSTALRRRTILLQDYYDWFEGLAVVGERVLVHNGIGSDSQGMRLAIFDLETGENLDNLELGVLTDRADPIWPSGLVCGGAFQ